MQGLAREWHTAQAVQLPKLAALTAGTARLLRAAAAAETAADPRGLLGSAATTLEAVVTRARACSDRLAAAMAEAVALPDGTLFVPPAAVPALEANAKVNLRPSLACLACKAQRVSTGPQQRLGNSCGQMPSSTGSLRRCPPALAAHSLG